MKLVALTGALLSLAVLAASPAFAASHPDNRAGMRGVGAITAAASAPVRPDDRPGLRGVGGAEAVIAPSGRPDGRLLPDGADLGDPRPTVVLVDGNGFDWGDATIGAVGALGASLLTAALGFAARRTRRSGEPHVTA